jgi:hypothetical protein
MNLREKTFGQTNLAGIYEILGEVDVSHLAHLSSQ